MTIPPLSLFAAAGAIGVFWSRFQEMATRVTGLFIVTVRLEDHAARAFNAYCWNCLRPSPSPFRRVTSSKCFVRPNNRRESVLLEAPPTNLRVFYYGRIPVMLRASTGWKSPGADAGVNTDGTCFFYHFRGSIDVDDFAQKAVRWYNQVHQARQTGAGRYRIHRMTGSRGGANRVMISMEEGRAKVKENALADEESAPIDFYRIIGWDRAELGEPNPGDPMLSLVYPKAVHDWMRSVKAWKGAEQWYRDRGLPWRMGCGIYGSPGSGKSRLVQAAAQLNDLPIYIFDLATMGNQDLAERWEEMLAHVPAIALVEDIDTVFDGRKNVSGSDLTFDCFLNCISGVTPSDGVITVITTNDASKIDDALGRIDPNLGISTRPGRIDRILILEKMEEDCRRQLATIILRDWPELIEPTVQGGDGMTAAQFNLHCATQAFERCHAILS